MGPVLRAQIERTFEVVASKSTSHELWFLCPECGDRSGHRSVNLETGRTFCFRCGKGTHNKGSFLGWARALGYAFDGTTEAPELSVDEAILAWSAPSQRHVELPPVRAVDLPMGFTPLEQEPHCAYSNLIREMAERKNLCWDDFAEAGAGFTRADPRWEPFCIFPVVESSLPVYFQGRTYVDVPGESTKLFPSRNEVRFGAACWIYNYDAACNPQTQIVIVVESILNVLSLRWKLRELGMTTVVPVCVFKHSVSRWQARKLANLSHVQEVCLFFDHDAIGAMWQHVDELGLHRRVTVAQMPPLPGNRKADPNDDVEVAVRAFEQREEFTALSQQMAMQDQKEIDVFQSFKAGKNRFSRA